MFIVKLNTKEIIMKRNDAVEWCIENINHWPKKDHGIISSPQGWAWIYVTGEMFLFMRDDVPITKDDWISPIEHIGTCKGKWVFEHSSGYAGFRCKNCHEWIYANKSKNCKCDDC